MAVLTLSVEGVGLLFVSRAQVWGPSGLRQTWAALSHDWQSTDAGWLVPTQRSQDSGPWVSTGWGANSLPRTP